MNWIIEFLLYAAAIYGIARVLPGVEMKGYTTAIGVAVLLSVVGFVIGGILHIFALPFKIVTLGLLNWLFTWIISAIVVKVVDVFVGGFRVNGFITALIFSAVISIAKVFIEYVIPSGSGN